MSPNSLMGKARFRHWRNKIDGSLDRREAKYATMFNEAIRKYSDEPHAFYPIAGAANYSLLYTMLRCLTELPVEKSLELGMGQSTMLFDALKADAVSIDHEAAWVARMGERVAHRCVHAPLVDREVHGFITPCFDVTPPAADLVIVDGPQGRPTRSRWGALEILDRGLGEEFIVIFDDAARAGEQDTIREFMNGRNVGIHLIQGTNAQIILYTPKFSAVQFF